MARELGTLIIPSGRPDAIHRATIRLTDIANLLDKDWEKLAEELNVPPNEVSTIKQEYANKPAQQAAAMLKVWQSNGNKATGKQRTNVTCKIYSGLSNPTIAYGMSSRILRISA